MKEVYFKGLIGIEGRRFIGCMFLDDDISNPDPITSIKVTTLTDGQIYEFNHFKEFEMALSHQRIISKVEYQILGLMSKLGNEIFLSNYFVSYPHKAVCDVVIKSLKTALNTFKKENLS